MCVSWAPKFSAQFEFSTIQLKLSQVSNLNSVNQSISAQYN